MSEGLKCPKCNGDLRTTEDNEYFHMCMHCVEGWTSEELEGVRRFMEWVMKDVG